MPTEKPEDHIARDCLASRVRTLNRMMTGIYDASLRPLGLKASQLNLLVVAAKLGMARPGQVCELLQMDASTLSRNVSRMQAQGWLEPVPEVDRRLQSFRLTPEGRALLKRAVPYWEKAQKEATAWIGVQGVKALEKLGNRKGKREPKA
jgi:DNA-binding MarR family transcriptional regulator